MTLRPDLTFATPRKLPKAATIRGRVVVLDLAFASEAGGGFDKLTKPFLEGLGPRLAAWIDHHDHVLHAQYKNDPRFVLATKSEHGACPEMITKEVVARLGPADSIVCHADFDGLASAAKWIRNGEEPYRGADDDARAIDTRTGTPSPTAVRIDRALRGRPRDHALFGLIVRHLADGLDDPSLWIPIDEAARELASHEARARELAREYALFEVRSFPNRVAILDASAHHGKYDKTTLLLLGQERATVALLLDRDTLTLAAPFDSGVNFLELLGLSGGMPTLVSVGKDRLKDALTRLGLSSGDVHDWTSR